MARGLVLLLLVLAGCGGLGRGAEDAPRSSGCPSNASTLALSVTPDPLTRGDAVEIDIRWIVDLPLTSPVIANLRVGAGPVVEVDVPLLLDTSYEYVGSIMNPFGAGAPAGALEVLTSAGVDSGCSQTPTAASAITLE